jgi:hypothetical protein
VTAARDAGNKTIGGESAEYGVSGFGFEAQPDIAIRPIKTSTGAQSFRTGDFAGPIFSRHGIGWWQTRTTAHSAMDRLSTIAGDRACHSKRSIPEREIVSPPKTMTARKPSV